MLKYKKIRKDELIHSVIYPAWIIYAPVFEAAQVGSFCFAEKKQYSIFQKMEESKKNVLLFQSSTHFDWQWYRLFDKNTKILITCINVVKNKSLICKNANFVVVGNVPYVLYLQLPSHR